MTSQRNGAPAPPKCSNCESLGLTNIRQQNGVSLEDIAAKTKISMRFLRAIEAEEFGVLPGGLFNTSYIRQYAAAIGFDETELLKQYKDKTQGAGEFPCENLRKGPASGTRNRLGRWFGLAAASLRWYPS